MLERATECLEYAGQRFLWQSRNVVRSRRSLRPQFWHHGEIDISAWCFGFLQSALLTPGARLPRKHARSFLYDSSYHPHLDFLYPRRHDTSQACESRKHHLGRRRRKLSGGSSRNYTCSPSKRFQRNGNHGSHASSPPSEGLLPQETGAPPVFGQSQAVLGKRLRTAFKRADPSESDAIWALYQSIENREKYSHRLLRYLAATSKVIDAKRSRDVLLSIPVSLRKKDDYYIATEALLRSGHGIDSVRDLIRSAVARGMGSLCWSHAFARSLQEMSWADTSDLWQYKPVELSTKHILTSGNMPDIFGLADWALKLTDGVEANEVDLGESGGAAKFLLHIIFSSPEYMRRSTVKEILSLTQNYYNLSLLEPTHYSTAISTLKGLQLPSTLRRSIFLYRNYCWRLTERPPYSMMANLFHIICSFGGPREIHYILDEFLFFHNVPARKYRDAAHILSKSGDVRTVEQLYNIFRQKFPSLTSAYYYAPYLYVYAKLGYVEETRRLFENLGALGIRRTVVLCNTLLLAHANAADFRGALSLFEKMIERDIYSSYTFSTLTAMCAKHGDTDTIISLLNMARKRNVPITAPLIGTAVESSLRNQKYAEAEKIAEEAIGKVEGNITSMWNMIIANYAYRYDLDSAMRIRNRMQRANISPDSKTYSALMLALAVAGRTDDARQLLQQMHLNSGLKATESHYSILLQGYSRERNRDMVSVIYHEIMERFGGVGTQSRDALIRANVYRDLQLHYERHGTRDDRSLMLAHAEQSLRDAVDHLPPALMKRSTTDELMKKIFPSAYYEHLIETYGTRGAFERVDALLDEYNAITKKGPHPIRLLSTLMLVHTRRAQYDQICACWDMAFERATCLASRPNKLPLNLSRRTQPHASDSIQRAIEASAPASSRGKHLRVYHAHRFVLSKCITYYIQALAFQGHHYRIPDAVRDIEAKGFVLATQNWSMYVKMMASSEKPEDQFRAFTVFEKKFMPNFISWKHTVRGYGKRPDDAPSLENLRGADPDGRLRPRERSWVSRRIWSHIQPDFMQPTYVTMMYLGSALLDYRERSVVDGGSELEALLEAAPKTFATLIEMPYMRDKFQSILLRGRAPSKEPTSKAVKFSGDSVFTGGVLGDGGLRLDTSPKEFLKEHGSLDEDYEEEEEEELFDDLVPSTGLKMEPLKFADSTAEDLSYDYGPSSHANSKTTGAVNFGMKSLTDNA